jgi:hypothetical protein
MSSMSSSTAPAASDGVAYVADHLLRHTRTFG